MCCTVWVIHAWAYAVYTMQVLYRYSGEEDTNGCMIMTREHIIVWCSFDHDHIG